MERLRGSAETTVDEKGRFKVPAIFRVPIEEAWGNEFFLTSITGRDVLVYPMPVWNAFEEKLVSIPCPSEDEPTATTALPSGASVMRAFSVPDPPLSTKQARPRP